jgi:hypothetical protein
MATETPSAPSVAPVPGTAVSGTALTTEVCRDADRFGELAPAWDALHRRSRTATPFQSHAWLHSWWLSYGVRGRLRVVLVRRTTGEGDDSGQLVAAAALMLVRRPFPVLVQLGGGISDFSDVLLDDDCAPEAAEALAKALAGVAHTAVVDLREVRPGAAAEQLYACWDGPRERLTDSVCLELPAVPMDDLLGRLARARAQRARAKLRKLDALGIEEHLVPVDDVPAAVGRLLALHRRQWQGRGVTPEHLSVRFSEHLTRSVRAMVESGEARLTEFSLAGELVASDLTLMSGQLEGGYLYGADPVLRERKVDVATMLLRHGVRQINASDRTTLSMLRGNESYKHHWRPDTVRNQRLLLARGHLAPFLRVHAARAVGRDRAAAIVKRVRRGGGEKG